MRRESFAGYRLPKQAVKAAQHQVGFLRGPDAPSGVDCHTTRRVSLHQTEKYRHHPERAEMRSGSADALTPTGSISPPPTALSPRGAEEDRRCV